MVDSETKSRIQFLAERKEHRDRWKDFCNSAHKLRTKLLPGEFGGLLAQVEDFTMMRYGRLRGIYEGICSLADRGIEGDFVECGTARGGGAALMSLTAAARGLDGTTWVYDTFEGLPAPSHDDPDYELALEKVGACRGEFEEVKSLFQRLGVLPQTRMVKGLFQDTLPETKPEAIAFLHLDGDWFDSTMVCLDELYDRVSTGGIIQIDDYGHWAGAKKALHQFLERKNERVSLRYLDYTGRQFLKP